jgi:hypothetical protein
VFACVVVFRRLMGNLGFEDVGFDDVDLGQPSRSQTTARAEQAGQGRERAKTQFWTCGGGTMIDKHETESDGSSVVLCR